MKTGFRNRIWPFLKSTVGPHAIRSCSIIFFGLAQLACAKNLALGAKYIFQPPANYEYTKSQNDVLKLTDGKFATGHFWTSREQTVGWYQPGPIQIELDLTSSYAVEGVCINSARGRNAEVSFPERIDLFVSSDQRNYAYAGDAMRGKNHEDGAYLIRKFCTDELRISARYVMLILQPRGSYTFVDEIEVLGSAENSREGGTDRTYNLRRVDIQSFQEKLFLLDYRAKTLRWMAENLLAVVANVAEFDVYALEISAAIDRLAGRLKDGSDVSDIARLEQAFEQDLLSVHRRILALRFKDPLIIWHKNPWSAFTPLDSPTPESQLEGALRFDLMRHGTTSDALILTNNAEKAQEYRVVVRVDGNAGVMPLIKLHEVVPVLVADGTTRGDPLVELINDTLTIRPGESKQVWLSVAAQNAPAAEYPAHIELVPTDPAQPANSIRLMLKVWPVTLEGRQRLKVNAWSYLSWRPIQHIPEQAVADLFAHHVNVFVLPESEAPWPRFGEASEPGWTVDYSKFDRFVRLHQGAETLLFYLYFNSDDRRSLGGRYTFMSQPWKDLFRAWIKAWSRHAMELGLTHEMFAFYPVDEPKDGEEAQYLLDTARLIKEVDPKLQVYTTLGTLRGLDLLRAIQLVDIFQVPDNELPSLKISVLKGFNSKIWSYSGGGKQADPLSVYRGQAWRAFQHGATGIGFWAYADTGERGTAWNDLDGIRPDFAVIYEGNNGIVSSKRWDAWREGVEDYELLYRVRNKLKSGKQISEFDREVGAAMSSDYQQFQQIRRHMLSIAAD